MWMKLVIGPGPAESLAFSGDFPIGPGMWPRGLFPGHIGQGYCFLFPPQT